MNHLADLSGKKFGRWTVIDRSYNSKKQTFWNCICECGTKKRVNTSVLKNGQSKSCGCLLKEIMSNQFSTHRDSKSKEYRTRGRIKERCYLTSCSQYHNYGGRGIKICERWLHSYENFLLDVGRAPSPKHSIDRINVNGNYEPSNCRWATTSEQANNKRDSRYFTINGVTLTFSQWCAKTGVNKSTANTRFYVRGWSIERVLVPFIRKVTTGPQPKVLKSQE